MAMMIDVDEDDGNDDGKADEDDFNVQCVISFMDNFCFDHLTVSLSLSLGLGSSLSLSLSLSSSLSLSLGTWLAHQVSTTTSR